MSDGIISHGISERLRKTARNLKKHKVGFEEEASFFGDPDHSIGEERRLMFGQLRMARMLAVISTHRRGEYRIISARLATRHERKVYEGGCRLLLCGRSNAGVVSRHAPDPAVEAVLPGLYNMLIQQYRVSRYAAYQVIFAG